MNPFAALESDDEDETFTKVQSSKKNDAKKKSQAKNNAATSSSSGTPSATPSSTSGPDGDKKASNRGGRGDNRNRARGAGRGGKETGDRNKQGKREYDRRSGTGRGTEVAKNGGGKAGWGSNQDEINAQRRELEDENAENLGEKSVVKEENVEPEEPEVPTFTLDEFMAKRNASREQSSIFTAVEERKVTDDFSNLKTKGDELTSFIVLGGSKTKSGGNKTQRSAGQTKVVDLGFHAAPKEDRREDRGDRRGGKGGGRGGDRGKGSGGRGGSDRRSGNRSGAKVDINDQSAFPSL